MTKKLSRTINQFENTLEQIRKTEIARYLKQLDKKEAEKIEIITKNMVRKIVKLPITQLKAACKRGEGKTLIEALNSLFYHDTNPGYSGLASDIK